MKRIIRIVACLAMACTLSSALADSVQVKLKNGAEVVGTIISFNPASEIVLDVAGFETKISMADVESVEKLAEAAPASVESAQPKTKVNPGAHPAVTHKGTIKTDKKGKQYIEVLSDDGQELTMDFLSKDIKALLVLPPRRGLDYKAGRYVVPDYVILDDDTYTVLAIGNSAFENTFGEQRAIQEVILPETLKIIGPSAFAGNKALKKIIIPDSVENIGFWAFKGCGSSIYTFQELYVPESVQNIGTDAFLNVGKNTSFRGYFKGNLTSIPSYITKGNCTGYGIDEEAVEDYYRRNGK